MTLKPSAPEVCVGLFMVVFAVVVGFATAAIPQSAYAKVGPAVVPWAVTAGLALFGVLLFIQGLRGGWYLYPAALMAEKAALLALVAGLVEPGTPTPMVPLALAAGVVLVGLALTAVGVAVVVRATRSEA